MIKIIRKLTPIIKKYSKFLKFLRVIFTRQQLTDKNSFIFKHSQEYKDKKKLFPDTHNVNALLQFFQLCRLPE